MKKINLLITLIVFLGFTPMAWGQEQSPIQNAIVESMRQGNASKISQYLNKNVELIIANKKDIYSKQQAVGILNDFFKTNPVKNFNLAHNSGKSASSFMIGSLSTTKGNFRVYILTRNVNNTTLIQQIRIETE